MQKNIYIIAGEASGDVIGAEVLKALPADTKIYGIGGPLMTQQGLQSLFSYSDLSVMGIVDVLKSYRTLKRRISQTINHIKSVKPDMILTIDAQGFSKRIVSVLRAEEFDCHYMHLVAPTVWAWRKNRAKTIGKYFDTLLCLYPFEPEYFPAVKAHFVGHPSVDALSHVPVYTRDKNSLAVLVGSRISEIKRCAPIYAETLKNIYTLRQTKIYIPALPEHKTLVQSIFDVYDFPYEIVSQGDKNKVLSSVSVALATSGTMTLELGILQTPMVIAYKIEPWLSKIMKYMYYKKHVGLPNLILGDKDIVPEYLQSDMTVDNLYTALCSILDDNGATQKQNLGLLKQEVMPPFLTFGNSVVHYIQKYI